jgi:hypothetical protein
MVSWWLWIVPRCWNASCNVGFVSLVLVVFLPYSVSSFKQVLSKMRFPVPFTSFPYILTFGNIRKRIPTFGNVKRVPTYVISWFLVCFWGRERSLSGGRSSLSSFALRWVRIRLLLPVWCFSLIWIDWKWRDEWFSFLVPPLFPFFIWSVLY